MPPEEDRSTDVENRSFKSGAGNDSLTLDGGSYAFTTDLSLDTAHLSLFLQNGAQAIFSGIQHLAGLSLSGTSTVTLADGAQSPLVVQSLSLDATSSLEIADNGLIVDYTASNPFSSLYGLIVTSASNGWSGTGIVSHTAAADPSQYALSIAANTALSQSSFAGQSVDSSSVLIRYTYRSDANLDGVVDVTDLGILAANWQQASRSWSQGDSNYDNVVNVTDLGNLAATWQKAAIGLSAPSPSGTSSSSSLAPAAASPVAAVPAREAAATPVPVSGDPSADSPVPVSSPQPAATAAVAATRPAPVATQSQPSHRPKVNPQLLPAAPVPTLPARPASIFSDRQMIVAGVGSSSKAPKENPLHEVLASRRERRTARR